MDPYLSADVIAEQIGQKFPPVNVEGVRNRMNGAGGGILACKLDSNFGELGSG